ncbi:MAG: TonB-dependent receptor [Bacteroidia bacterium]|nr:TonB-dependent receptor [Bacteroidia bacterium]
MKRKFVLILLVLGVLPRFSNLMAQNSLIRGKISDAVNGYALPGASIAIADAHKGVASDLQGIFEITVTSGEVSLLIRYLGYADTTITVSAEAGKTVFLDIQLTSKTYELSRVEITGLLQGQARALNQQKNADNIKNIVAADQIGRFPDPNAAEALQRVPGVNIERDQGEGRYVLVRGLAPQFTNMSVNGEQIPSPEADVRFVALDAIPSDQLASMEVTKSLTPDMDGDAIGGSVNLVTRSAQSSTPQIAASLVGGYNNLMQKPNAQGSLLYGQRFGKGEKLGFLVNASHYQNNLGSDNVEREPFDNELDLRDYELTRTRLGLSSTIDYRFNKNNEIYFRTLATRFTDREWRRRYIFIPEDGEIERHTKDRFESQSVRSFNLGGRHTYPGIQLDYEAQYSYGEQNTPYDFQGIFIAENEHSLDFSDPESPVINAPGYLDNNNYEFDELEVGNTFAKDQNITAKFNLGFPYRIGTNNYGLLKMGAKLRSKTKSYDITVDKYGNLGGVPNLDAFEGGLLDENFLGGKYVLSNPLDISRLIDYFNENSEQFEPELEDKAIDEALEAYTATEDVVAGYLMARQQLNRLLLLGGVRYEYTRTTYQSNDVVIAANGDLEEIVPVEGGTDYGFFLPQLHLKYAAGENTNFRAAATYSYARPNFSEIIPAQEINLEDREATAGNPNLLPVSAFNVDLLGEHYFGNVGIVSGGLFFKSLDDFIYRRVVFNSNYPLTGEPIATGVDVIQAQNGNQANLLGVEVAFQRGFNFLSGPLSRLTLYLNYTYTNSNATIQSREADEDNPDTEEEIPLPGQASHVGNASLAYENKGVSVRISTNFNGSYLSEVGGSPEEDIYVKSRLQLDLNASVTLTPKIRLFAEFLNLTNQPFEVYQGSEDILIQREFYSWWSRLGLKFDF